MGNNLIMSKVSIGKKVPAFTLPATGDQTIKLSALKGKNIILYFYPKDSTPGCTLEGQDFRDNIRKFSSRNTIILGVSRDKMSSHEKFKEKQSFPFDLLSDEDETLCNLFDVIKEKNMYGKKHMGIERSTFLIDEKGIFVDRVLNRRKKYVQWLEELVEAGLVGTSSEAVGKGIEIKSNGEITKWPLKKDTLTVTPMEPRMMTANTLNAYKALDTMLKLS